MRFSDVLISGGGIVGLALAVALKQAFGGALSVAVRDPSLMQARAGTRASAIAAGPRRMLENFGVWQAVADKAQPILDMAITDSRLADPVRPVFLNFGGPVSPGEPFAHMVLNADLIEALKASAKSAGVDLVADGVATFELARDDAVATLTSGARHATKLIVAADGAKSRLRKVAGISVAGWDYPQSGLVATLAHEGDHAGVAHEHFLPAGPFATLPLTENRSSIVWTETHAEAARLLALAPADFLIEVENRFGHALGALTLLDRPRAFPLSARVARRFVAGRFALMGDAAHVIHPLAGQGLNLGLRDAAALVEAMAERVRLGLDPGVPEVLTAYERARRFDTLAMAAATDGLNRLFSNDAMPARLARDLGLGLIDRMPGLKQAFAREAAGLTGAVPRLMRKGGR